MFLFTACANKIVPDPFPPSIDTGHKRVETVICGSHDVGENGCVFPDGNLYGALKIFKVMSGEVSVRGCGMDKSYAYTNDEIQQWIEIPLSGKVSDDCVIDIYQKVIFPGQDKLDFPIYGMRGTVSIGACSVGISCDFKQRQSMLNVPLDDYVISGDGSYLIRGCGQVVDGPSPIKGSKSIKLDLIWPGGYPKDKSECLFVTGIKGVSLQKRYFKVSLFKRSAEFLSTPEIKKTGKQIEFMGDEYASITMIDGKVVVDHHGKFTPDVAGNYLRFYTANGRSIVAFVQNGEIVWTK